MALPHWVAGMTITCAARDRMPASDRVHTGDPVLRACHQHIRRVPSETPVPVSALVSAPRPPTGGSAVLSGHNQHREPQSEGHAR